MNTGEDFIYGKSFQWFTGVVEDINDPEEMGRYKIRCFGYHTDDKERIPTESLPWAHVMLPITSASMTGIGQSATGILQGSWVVGFFRDGTNAQDPLILGSIPSKSTIIVDSAVGFNDPAGVYPKLVDNKPTNDTPQQARKEYNEADSYINRDVLNQKALKDPSHVTGFPQINTTAPVYPKNKVIQTESGHVIEYDDTTDNERLLQYHKTGTYHEVQTTGDDVTVVNGKGYKLVIEDENVRILGTCNLVIDQNCNTHIKGDWDITVDGTKTERVTGDVTETYSSKLTQDVTGVVSETYKSSQSTQVKGNIDIDGARIDLN
jgi:hypothetical protein